MSDFLIEIHRDLEELRLYSYEEQGQEFRRIETYTVATGTEEHPTPRGRFLVNNRQFHPTWVVPDVDWAKDAGLTPGAKFAWDDERNPIKGRWIGFRLDVGIHGTADTASLGHPASHGCVRMAVTDVEELYPFARKGTPVIVR